MVKKTSRNQTALVDFLREFAKHMLASGVSLEQFQGAARIAYVQAAMERARLRNSRINQSALAAITGLSRLQIRSLLRKAERGHPEPQSRLQQVLTAWQKDPQFRRHRKGPPTLPLRNGPGSFSALSRKYGGDVSYKALLAELMKLKYVRVEANHVTLTNKGIGHSAALDIHELSSGLAFALRQEIPMSSDVGVFTAEAIYRTPSAISRLLIKRRLIQSTKAFAADIRATGDAEASKSKARGSGITRTSILVLTMDGGE